MTDINHVIVFLGSLLSIIWSLAAEEQAFALQWTDWLLVVGHVATFIFIYPLYFCMSTRIPGSLISIIGSTSTMYVSIAQYTFLSDIKPGNHNWLEIFGACVILISSVGASIVKAKVKEQSSHSVHESGTR